DRSRSRRSEGENIPFKAIREAVVNALVHRDYDIDGAKVQLRASADGISIKSPGGPLPPITLEQLASFTAPALSRNPKLHYVFGQMHLAEEAGRGMHTMQELRQDPTAPLPTITFEAPYLSLTLNATPEAAVRELAGAEVEQALQPEERQG